MKRNKTKQTKTVKQRKTHKHNNKQQQAKYKHIKTIKSRTQTTNKQHITKIYNVIYTYMQKFRKLTKLT